MSLRNILCCLALACGACASANSDYLDTFLTHYKLAETSPLAEKSCGVCHVSDSDFSFNAYGKDVKKALADKNASEITPAILVSVEGADSDGDGTPNGSEIAAGTAPGDPKSGGTGAVAATTPDAPSPAKPAVFPPKNGFHPAIVHFPIALFIIGLLFDLYGAIKKDKNFLWAGWCNVALAAFTSLCAVATGFLATMFMKLPLKGLILNHMLYGLGASFLMWIMVALRIHRHERMTIPHRALYYLLAIACFLIISWAGHLGGIFVYGE